MITVFDVLVFSVPAFAALNRFRGGGVIGLWGETPTNARSQVRRMVFLAAVAAFVWWGVVWLTLWGLMVGLAPAFAMASAWPLLWASMGVIYWATGNWMKHTTGNAGDGREVAEWIFGGLLGGTLALSMAF